MDELDIVLTTLIQKILEGAETFFNEMLLNLADLCLRAENTMTSLTGSSWFDTVYQIFFGFGITMIVVKFLKKGFECYVGWTEGDPDSDPAQLVINFVRALAVAVCFPVLYGWLADGVTDLTDKLITAIGDATAPSLGTAVTAVATNGLFFGLVALIFFIMLFVLWVQFMARGLEIVVLRCGMPWACMGLIDSDKGVFGTYMKRLFQSVLTVIVQISLVKLGIGLMVNLHGFWAIACLMMSMKTPKLLQDFLMSYGPNGGLQGVSRGAGLLIRKLATKGG